jgi:hypothetical protein
MNVKSGLSIRTVSSINWNSRNKIFTDMCINLNCKIMHKAIWFVNWKFWIWNMCYEQNPTGQSKTHGSQRCCMSKKMTITIQSPLYCWITFLTQVSFKLRSFRTFVFCLQSHDSTHMLNNSVWHYLNTSFLPTFPKKLMGFIRSRRCLSICVPTSNFWTNW